ncbi:VOC family protein [Chitinimonas koreensis]|uniref:VOC family protein n=1 Tax=Chitinimonas koreensis TaxID=356302 RepID=UPI0003F67DB1|nr:VOC family protein [Chitinimonas koreensis]QNM98314.1 glyoxalase [Chitinimonas koreensis]
MGTPSIKPFVPARDFDVSRRFYRALGFEERWCRNGVAELGLGDCAFLLQDFYRKDWADNAMIHLLVEDADALWQHSETLLEAYPLCRARAPRDEPWGVRQCVLRDPCGVLWHIGHSLER